MNDADAADLDDDYSDTKSVDSCEEYIGFESIRNPSTQLEESISFSWPGIYCDQVAVNEVVDDGGIDTTSSSTAITSGESSADDDNGNRRKLRKIILSTLLEEDDIAPLFDGARWAGTRLWRAAIRSIQYLAGHLPDTYVHPSIRLPKLMSATPNDVSRAINADNNNYNNKHGVISVLELGCGLGVPGMIFHLLGCNVVLTDQEDILSQLRKNVKRNFPSSSSSRSTLSEDQTTRLDNEQTSTTTTATTIQALPLSWSRKDVHSLLKAVGRYDIGFDIVVNCDCVFEPLYGKR